MTASASVVDLKPCPFCGGAARIDKTKFGRPVFRWAKCSSCGAGGTSYPREDDARAAWNTRTPHPAEQDAREAVARAARDSIITTEFGTAVDVEHLTASVSALTQAAPDGWRPIETAPKDGTWIVALKLGFLRTGEPIALQTCRWDGSEWGDSNGHDLEGYEPDLWMPLLPAPPAQGAGG